MNPRQFALVVVFMILACSNERGSLAKGDEKAVARRMFCEYATNKRRLFRESFVGATVSSGISTVFAQNVLNRVTAQSFVVIDESGRKRGDLGVSSKGLATLTLYG
jgi:hypothetical protein